MNKILKKILNTAKDIAIDTATEAVPGAGLAISGVSKLFDKNDDNNIEALNEIESGTVQALNSIKMDAINNPVLFLDGLADLQRGFNKVRVALKKN